MKQFCFCLLIVLTSTQVWSSHIVSSTLSYSFLNNVYKFELNVMKEANENEASPNQLLVSICGIDTCIQSEFLIDPVNSSIQIPPLNPCSVIDETTFENSQYIFQLSKSTIETITPDSDGLVNILVQYCDPFDQNLTNVFTDSTANIGLNQLIRIKPGIENSNSIFGIPTFQLCFEDELNSNLKINQEFPFNSDLLEYQLSEIKSTRLTSCLPNSELSYDPNESFDYLSGFSSNNPFGNSNVQFNQLNANFSGRISNEEIFEGSYLVGIQTIERRAGEIIAEYFQSWVTEISDCNKILEIDFKESDYTLCLDDTLRFNIPNQNEIQRFSWSSLPELPLSNSPLELEFITSEIGNYTFFLTAENSNCFDEDSFQLSIKEQHIPSIQIDTLFRSCDSIVLNWINNSKGMDSSVWITGSGKIQFNDTIQLSFLNQESKEIKLTSFNQNSCNIDSSFTINYTYSEDSIHLESPTIELVNEYCDSIQLRIIPNNSTYQTYNWIINGVQYFENSPIITVNSAEQEIYLEIQLLVEDNQFCNQNQELFDQLIYKRKSPEISIEIDSSLSDLCSDTATLAFIVDTLNTRSFSIESELFNLENNTKFSIQTTKKGVFNIQSIARNESLPCFKSDTTNLEIELQELLKVSLVYDSISCLEDSVLLRINANQNAFQFEFNEQEYSDSVLLISIQFLGLNTFPIQLYSERTCNNIFDTLNITAGGDFNNLELRIEPSQPIYLGRKYQVTNIEGASVDWKIENQTVDDSININFIREEEGEFLICYTQSDSLACTFQQCESFFAISFPELVFPNAFSPDLDGINDEFRPLNPYFNDYQLKIYDKFGNLVFTSNNPSIGWDGTINGKTALEGVYIYQSMAITFSNQVIRSSGNLTLIR